MPETKQFPPQTLTRREVIKTGARIVGGIATTVALKELGGMADKALSNKPLEKPKVRPAFLKTEASPKEKLLADMKKRLIDQGVLQKWVNERSSNPQNPMEGFLSSALGKERAARREVAQAIIDDLTFPINPNQVINYLTPLVSAFRNASLQNPLEVRMVYTITGAKFSHILELQPDQGIYIAKELTPEGHLISQSLIDMNTGSTKLTLDFKGDRFVGANPEIHDETRLPKAAATHFKLIATAVKNSLGI